MTNHLDYLGRGLNQRTNDVAEEIARANGKSMAEAASKGMLGSGRMLTMLQENALGVFTDKATDAIQFAFNLTESHGDEVVQPLNFCLGRMVEVIMARIVSDSSRLGLSGNITGPQVNATRTALTAKKDRLMDDFTHGMMGSARLKKDPIISVVTNQTNSPGAVQQVGLGTFSQTAFVHQHQALVQAIDAALASPEFGALSQPQKEAFQDIADTLKEEAVKSPPDPGKLKRWGGRLVELSKDLGLAVAADAISKVLMSIFAGG